MKMRNKIIFLCLVFCVIFSISAVAASDANDTQVALDDSDNINPISEQADTDIQSTTNQKELKSTNSDDDKLQMMGTDAASEKRSFKAYIQPKKLSTSYGSGNNFKVKVIDSGKNPVSNAKLLLRIYTGNKVAKKTITTGWDGIAQFDASRLSVGTHKIIISSLSKNVKASQKTSSAKVTKASLLVVAPKVTNAYKLSGKFKVAVKNKATKRGIANVKVIMKVYTGSKYKAYVVKTNKRGVAAINTNKFSKGSHKVLIKVKATKNFKAKSAVSAFKITNKRQTHISVGGSDTWFTAVSGSYILWLNGHVALKDSNGNLIKNKEMIYICRSGSFSGTVLDKGTFTSASDDDDYTRNMGSSAGAYSPLYFTFIFKGDSKYMPCKINFEFSRQFNYYY